MKATNASSPRARSKTGSPDKLARLIARILDDGKAEDLVTIDLRGKSSIGDYMVVGSGRSQRHVAALAGQLVDKLGDAGVRHLSVEGLEQGDWVLVDAGSVIIHLFRPEIRELYQLENMWGIETPQDSQLVPA